MVGGATMAVRQAPGEAWLVARTSLSISRWRAVSGRETRRSMEAMSSYVSDGRGGWPKRALAWSYHWRMPVPERWM